MLELLALKKFLFKEIFLKTYFFFLIKLLILYFLKNVFPQTSNQKYIVYVVYTKYMTLLVYLYYQFFWNKYND